MPHYVYIITYVFEMVTIRLKRSEKLWFPKNFHFGWLGLELFRLLLGPRVLN